MSKTDKSISTRLQLAVARILASTPLDALAFDLLAMLKKQRANLPDIDLLRAQIRLRRGANTEAVEMLKEELRLFPQNDRAARLLQETQRLLHEQTENVVDDLADIYNIIAPYTMLSRERLQALLLGAKNICDNDTAGNFVECGVAAGGSSALLAWVVKKYSKRDRVVYSFDTFEGMPEPTSDDTHAGIQANKTGWGEGTCAAPLRSLQSVASSLGVCDLIKPVAGLFQNTLPATKKEIGPIAFLHLDGDWYESTKAILDNLYEQIVDGAYLQVDDYGYWEGCKKAIDEFEEREELQFMRHQIDSTGVWFTKPETRVPLVDAGRS